MKKNEFGSSSSSWFIRSVLYFYDYIQLLYSNSVSIVWMSVWTTSPPILKYPVCQLHKWCFWRQLVLIFYYLWWVWERMEVSYLNNDSWSWEEYEAMYYRRRGYERQEAKWFFTCLILLLFVSHCRSLLYRVKKYVNM